MPGVDDPDALASQLREGLGHPDAFALFMDAVKAQSERPAFWENYFGRAIGSGSILPLLCMSCAICGLRGNATLHFRWRPFSRVSWDSTL